MPLVIKKVAIPRSAVGKRSDSIGVVFIFLVFILVSLLFKVESWRENVTRKIEE
jgi:hypothetical protein